MRLAVAGGAIMNPGGCLCLYRPGGQRGGQRNCSRRRFEFDMQLMAGGDAQRILQQTQIIVLEPDFAEFVRRLQRGMAAVNCAHAQRREPHIVGVGTQFGTEMFLR